MTTFHQIDPTAFRRRASNNYFMWSSLIGTKVQSSEYGHGEVIDVTTIGDNIVKEVIVKFPHITKKWAPNNFQVLVKPFKISDETLQILSNPEFYRDELRSRVHALLEAYNFQRAEEIYKTECAEWWSRSDFNSVVKDAKKQAAKSRVIDLLYSQEYSRAEELYVSECALWWKREDYNMEISRAIKFAQFMPIFIQTYQNGSLKELDTLFHDQLPIIDISSDEFTELKLPRVRDWLDEIGIQLDPDQLGAVARPDSHLLITARAGAGKTRTVCARAALSICDEKLDPNQVLILAFNKTAATEVKQRVQELSGIIDYENARTFHSLAYQLVKPEKKLIFDDGGLPSAREQSRFVQRVMERILNPAFKESMVEFFRMELEQIENMGRDLGREEYLIFRRSLELVSLNGERVKSNGEKYIADFLFEHEIQYKYEKAWVWKADFLDGTTYRPDFSIIANGKDYILEHWAFDPNDNGAALPDHWSITSQEYRRQIMEKRQFWNSKNVTLIESHTGLMGRGREAFEKEIRIILENIGIRCQRLPKEEIVRRVFDNDFAISRMADLFLQFIQRAKKRGWSADALVERIEANPDSNERLRLFHELALRAYREYEAMLKEQDAMDFDDLLSQATEEVQARGSAASIHLGHGKMISLDSVRWILIDEYQDFSELYFQMVEAILVANPDIRIVAVGDDWQAINSFAGAELRFFREFANYFSDAETVGVRTNYRSAQSIVEAGNRLMKGRGDLARFCRATIGQIELRYLGDIWIEFRPGDQFRAERDSDAKFLAPRPDGRGPSGNSLRQAQAIKVCCRIILEEPKHKVLLLARTNKIYGLDLNDFRARLIKSLSDSSEHGPETWRRLIFAMTAHRSKGQEAHTVIILNANQRQFPKVHPDNLLFEIFGQTPQAVLEEERRLFYVAITRAENRLFFLCDKGDESPYIETVLAGSQTVRKARENLNPESRPLGDLATRIQAQIGIAQDNTNAI